MRRLSILWSWLTDSLRMPLVNLALSEKLEKSAVSDPIFTSIREMRDSDIDQYLDLEWSRAKELDDKLSRLTATLSIGLTLGGVASKFILEQLSASPARTAFLVLILVSMAHFLLGALLGFSGLRPKPRYGYGPDYLNRIASGGDTARRAKESAAEGFMITNIIRNNEASAAIDLIRNGILFYGLALVLSLTLTKPELEPSVVDKAPKVTRVDGMNSTSRIEVKVSVDEASPPMAISDGTLPLPEDLEEPETRPNVDPLGVRVADPAPEHTQETADQPEVNP